MAQGGTYKVEVRKRKDGRSRRFSSEAYPGFAYVRTGKYAYHWERSGMSAAEAAEAIAKCKRDKLEVKVLDERQMRSSGYRDAFLRANPGPYRCAYCHRKLGGHELTVDHLVPVAAAQSRRGRRMLRRLGAETVNDPVNLAASCMRCNLRKGSKTGLWTLRGRLGRHGWWWPLTVAVRLLAAAALLALLLYVLKGFGILDWVAANVL